MWLVAGLGNPGREYERNRHNVGFLVADLLAARTGVRFGRHRRAVADVAQARLGVGVYAPQLIIAKPLTYMNLVGGPVTALCQFYKIDPAQLVAVHDELDLPYGVVRAKFGGGEGGHNGLRSISRSLSTKDYLRVRVGISRPPGTAGSGRLRAVGFLRHRAEGSRLPGRPGGRHRRVAGGPGPRADPERLSRHVMRRRPTVWRGTRLVSPLCRYGFEWPA